MKLLALGVALLLIVTFGVALGIALAPFILPALGWGVLVLVALLALVGALVVLSSLFDLPWRDVLTRSTLAQRFPSVFGPGRDAERKRHQMAIRFLLLYIGLVGVVLAVRGLA